MDVVNENASFDKDDVFHRVETAKKAMELVTKHQASRGACVIDINAPWGMGKTTLLKMWINELAKSDEYRNNAFSNVKNQCVYYNAWEHDYYDDALTPVIYEICGSISAKANKSEKWLTGFRDKMKAMISTGVGVLTTVLCYRNTRNDLLASGIGGMAAGATDAALHIFEGKEPEEVGQIYLDEIEKRNAFHDAVADLANECGKLFIFVDELDRCKPIFAIQTLECIKHYFNIPNVVFIFATDMNQLAHTVESYYGHGMDAGGYFLKFFDYIIHLPIPNVRELLQYAYPTISVDAAFYDYINEICKVFTLTPRETPWVLRRAKTVWDSAFAGHRKVNLSASISFIVFLITIKTKMPDRYSHCLIDRENLSDLIRVDGGTFLERCITFLQSRLAIDTYDLEKEISESNERYTRRRIDGVMEDNVDFEEVFLHTLYAVCAPQMAVSQMTGEALLAALELS